MKTFKFIYNLIDEINEIALAKFGCKEDEEHCFTVNKYLLRSMNTVYAFIAKMQGQVTDRTYDIELILSITDGTIDAIMPEFFKNQDKEYNPEYYKIVLKTNGEITMEEYNTESEK